MNRQRQSFVRSVILLTKKLCFQTDLGLAETTKVPVHIGQCFHARFTNVGQYFHAMGICGKKPLKSTVGVGLRLRLHAMLFQVAQSYFLCSSPTSQSNKNPITLLQLLPLLQMVDFCCLQKNIVFTFHFLWDVYFTTIY